MTETRRGRFFNGVFLKTLHGGIAGLIFMLLILPSVSGDPLHIQFRYSPDSAVFRSVHHFCIFYVSGEELVLEAYDVDLNPIDHFRIRKRK